VEEEEEGSIVNIKSPIGAIEQVFAGKDTQEAMRSS